MGKGVLIYASRTTEKEVKQKKKAILACNHFQASNHNFQQHVKFTPIEITIKPAATKQLRMDSEAKNTLSRRS